MGNKKSTHQKSRIALAHLTPVHLIGSYVISEAINAEVEPEKWQAKGKRRKPRIK